MLGLPWNKEQDSLSITVPLEKATLSKRGILAKLAQIYDPLVLVSPVIYRAGFDTKGAWNADLSRDLAKLWVKWESRLPQSFTMPRSLVVHREESNKSIYIRLETRAQMESQLHPELTRA